MIKFGRWRWRQPSRQFAHLQIFYRLGGLYWVTSGALDSCHANMPTEIFLSQQTSYTLDVSGGVDSWPVILSTGSLNDDLGDVHKQRVEPWTAATSLCPLV